MKKLSKQLNICSQCWHEVTPPAQLPFLFCSGHNYNIFPTGWCLLELERPSEEVSFPPTAGSDRVWSSHLYVSNQLSPAGRSTLSKLPKESVFALESSANTHPKCSLLKPEAPVGRSPPGRPTTNTSCTTEHKTSGALINTRIYRLHCILFGICPVRYDVMLHSNLQVAC